MSTVTDAANYVHLLFHTVPKELESKYEGLLPPLDPVADMNIDDPSALQVPAVSSVRLRQPLHRHCKRSRTQRTR